MSRFILIDHSIRGVGGHYYEYALNVLTAAAEKGYTPVLATHRDFGDWEDISFLSGNVHAIYAYDARGRSNSLAYKFRIFKLVVAGWRRFGLVMRIRILYSSVLMLLARSDRGSPSPPGTRNSTDLGERLSDGRIGRIYRYYNRVLRARRIREFEKGTRELFESVLLEGGDQVFIPTLSQEDLKGLMSYLRSDADSRKATWHLLFRRNIYSGQQSQYAGEDDKLQSTRELFNRVPHELPNHRIFFYTDTQRLTDQYERLRAVPFRTLPIPVNPRLHPDNRSLGNASPLNIIYVGDARMEKGYHHLYDIVRNLWGNYVAKDKIRFTFHSTIAFNVPERQAEVLVTRAQLAALPGGHVTLIYQPLDPPEYIQVMGSGDISLLLYDANSYYARSSGVLAESLSAGIPVVVPSGSWLAEQISGDLYWYYGALVDECTKMETMTLGNITQKDARQGLSVASIEVPEGVTLVMFTLPHGLENIPELTAQQIDSCGMTVNRQILAFQEAVEFQPRALVRIEFGVNRLQMSWSARLNLDSVRIDLLKGKGKHALGVIGLSYVEPREVPFLLKDMIDHYGHYRKTAKSFSESWRKRHCPEGLIEELEKASYNER